MSFSVKVESDTDDHLDSKPIGLIQNNDDLLAALHPVPNFQNRDDIKPWLHEKLDSRGVCLVIERSDASKVVFKCKSIHRKSSVPRSAAKLVNGRVKRVRTHPEESCPFRLRVSYSVKQKIWSVTIIKPEHNPDICSNFGGSPVSANSSPTNRSTTKRSWTSAYTPASTTSPMMSIYGSPASTLTPASEMNSMEFDRFTKKQRQTYESPLSHIVDPLDPLQLPEDLSDLKYIEQQQQIHHLAFDMDNALPLIAPGAITLPRKNSLEIDDSEFDFGFSNNPTINQFEAERLFEMDIESKVSNMITSEDLFKTVYDDIPPEALESTIQSTTEEFIDQPTPSPSSSKLMKDNTLNINTDIQIEEDADSLMYLLSASNSNYTLEELENLDKAMGVDANDQFLLSMFHQNI